MKNVNFLAIQNQPYFYEKFICDQSEKFLGIHADNVKNITNVLYLVLICGNF